MPLNRILSVPPFLLSTSCLLKMENSIVVHKLNRSSAFHFNSSSTPSLSLKSAASKNFSLGMRRRKTILLLFVSFWLKCFWKHGQSHFSQKARQTSGVEKSLQTIEMQLIGQDFEQTTFFFGMQLILFLLNYLSTNLFIASLTRNA